MINHPFNQAKSAFKAKQYLSCGVPVVASDIGDTSKFVVNNLNGILAKNNHEFKNGIEYFMSISTHEYFKYSKKCLELKESFSMEKFCNEIIQLSNEK